ncbi:hypothetical protein COLO4_37350 [Corchorus olitorius]|uniref:F-box associated beta-propeller type 3 domain-containing protein n=1 Tax=Corchorus olitorius TaxID=93759 RepID=A0A1R3G285_9ROSI|nr:hypothetical protein COLO4_37350 [Corchorus olitorius]
MLCRSFRGNPQEATYYIYNPTTNQYRLLPAMQGSDDPSWDSRIIFDVKLAFDPSKSPHYKVICISHNIDLPDHYQMEVYSSKTGSWKPSGSPFTGPDDARFSNGVYWNGAIHWFNILGVSLRFDIEEEQFREIPMPTFRGDLRYRHFEESGGHLYLMEVSDSDTSLYDVYEMARDMSGWFLKYKVDFHPIAAVFPEMLYGSDDIYRYTYTILGVIQEKTDDDSFLVLHIPNKKAIWYNFKDASFTMFHDFASLYTQVVSGVGRDIGRVFLFLDQRKIGSLEYCDTYQFIESFACV